MSIIAGTYSKRLNFQPQSNQDFKGVINDLQFAIDAGDKEFAPAVKLILREAIHLAHHSQDISDQDYYAKLASAKAAFQALLAMQATHPVARQLQKRYRMTYSETFWDFLDKERMLAKQSAEVDVVASEGNVHKSDYFLAKRIMDVVLSSVLLVVLSPLFLILAVAIMLDSKGSPFFVHERVGVRRRSRAGLTTFELRTFKFYKFRSMRQNSDQSLHQAYIKNWVKGEVEASDDKQAQFKLTRDPRVTRVGHLIRKTSLDELPQLFNVLKGDMSLVGPRPVPVYEAAMYTPEQRERLASIGGITGLWQIEGRGQVSFEEQIEMDIRYIHEQSLWQDIKILVMTLPAVLSQRGAR